MKVLLTFALVLMYAAMAMSADPIYPDVPPPSGVARPPNMQTFAAGTLIIDMGEKQIENTDLNGKSVSGLFNLYAYSYAIHLLHNKVPLYWAIKSNKQKDDVDFTATSARVHPTGPYSGSSDGAWGSTSAASNTFKGGPLLIKPLYATQALDVLSTLKSQQTGGGRFQSVVVYRLTQETQVDIRHVILHKPHVFVSIISGDPFNYGTQSELFGHLGLIQGTVENGGMYELVDNGTRIENFDEDTCHTLFTEPHIIYDIQNSGSCPRCLPSVPLYRAALFRFVTGGGNFLAECAGVTSYENSLWSSQYHPESGVEGAFLSKNGIKGLGNKGNEWGGRVDDNNLRYNADLPLAQFVGNMGGDHTGTISEWYLLGSGTEASLFKNNGHSIVENTKSGASLRAAQNLTGELRTCQACSDTQLNYVPDGRTAMIVSGAKIGTNNQGGMVFYVGAHSWWQDLRGTGKGIQSGQPTPSGYTETMSLYNGRRVILNAMLTPSTRPAQCALTICPEDFECPSQELLGSCQRCECVNGDQVITTDPSLCGSCEECIQGNCVRNDSICVDQCHECVVYDNKHVYCQERENCTTSTGLTPAEKGGIAAAVIGAVLGAIFGAALIGLGVAVVIWKLIKKPPKTPHIEGVRNMEQPDLDVNDNKMFNDPVKVYDVRL